MKGLLRVIIIILAIISVIAFIAITKHSHVDNGRSDVNAILFQ